MDPYLDFSQHKTQKIFSLFYVATFYIQCSIHKSVAHFFFVYKKRHGICMAFHCFYQPCENFCHVGDSFPGIEHKLAHCCFWEQQQKKKKKSMYISSFPLPSANIFFYISSKFMLRIKSIWMECYCKKGDEVDKTSQSSRIIRFYALKVD